MRAFRFDRPGPARSGVGTQGRARRRRRARLLGGCLTLLLAFSAGVGDTMASASGLKAMWGPALHNGVPVFPTFRTLGVKIYEDVLRWNEIARRRPRRPRDPKD